MTLTFYKMRDTYNVGNEYLKEILELNRLEFIKKNEKNKNIS